MMDMDFPIFSAGMKTKKHLIHQLSAEYYKSCIFVVSFDSAFA